MNTIDQSVNSDLESSETNTTSSVERRALRLISLTDVIRRDMEACDDSSSSKSLKNIKTAIEELTETYLKERKFSETFIKRQDAEQYLENWSSINTVSDEKSVEKEAESSRESLDATTNEIVVELNGTDENVKYESIEKRLTLVEHKLNKIFKILTAGRKPKSKKEKTEETCCKTSSKDDRNKSDDAKRNIYDEMFYEWRENSMNSNFYKKSEETLKLNKKPVGNQFVPPPSIADMFPLSSERQLNRPMFIKAVLRKDIKESGLLNKKV